MNLQLIIAALIAAAGFGSAWQIQSWRADAKENERAQQQLVDQRQSAATAIRRADNVITATNAATVRDAGLRRDADGARGALVGLSDAADSALRASGASLDACLVRAATFSELLGTVAAEGGDLAQKADRHANDAKTLMDAWPK